MPNELVTRKKKNPTVEVTSIIANPVQRSKLQNYIDEAVRCKVKALDETENIRNIRNVAIEELGIDPKMFSALVNLYFNNNFEQKKEELERLEAAINALMQTNT